VILKLAERRGHRVDRAVKTSGLIAVCWLLAAATPGAAQSQNGG